MKVRKLFKHLGAAVLAASLATAAQAQSLAERNELLFQQLQDIRGLSNSEINRVRQIFANSPNGWMGQGNPAVTQHPLTPEEAAARLGGSVAQVQASYRNRAYERICGGPFRVPLYDPETQSPSDATVCADMFEYPNIPMVYPVVWVRANEAAALCAAEGGRIGDAHEWEGAAAGQLLPPDYPFDLIRGLSGSAAVNAMRNWHNNPLRLDQRAIFNWSVAVGGLCDRLVQERLVQRRQLYRMRVQHLPGWILSTVPVTPGGLRHRRQCRGAYEPAPVRGSNGLPRVDHPGRDRDERVLVYLGHDPCP